MQMVKQTDASDIISHLPSTFAEDSLYLCLGHGVYWLGVTDGKRALLRMRTESLVGTTD